MRPGFDMEAEHWQGVLEKLHAPDGDLTGWQDIEIGWTLASGHVVVANPWAGDSALE